MKNLVLLLLCSLIGHVLQAQNDPFAIVPSNQNAALSAPNELPDFDQFLKEPHTISIPPITCKELSYAIQDNREKVFVLDARSIKEYKTSHIDKAKRAGYEDFSVERIWMVDRKARVIVYSANYSRGKTLAQYLVLMGFSDVQLLEGGLINWKNNGHQVVDKKGKTDKVHVGNRSNLKLLKSGLGIY